MACDPSRRKRPPSDKRTAAHASPCLIQPKSPGRRRRSNVGSLAGFNGFIGLGAKPEQIVSCLRRCAGGPNDGAIILAQDLEPGADIVGVAHRSGCRATRRRRRWLFRQSTPHGHSSTRSCREIRPSCRSARPMTKLMQGGPVPVDRFEIGVRPRDLDEIMVGAVEGAIAADAEVGAGRNDERLGLRQDHSLGNWCGSGRQFPRQIFALVGVEHREPLQEWDRDGLVSIALGPPTFLVRCEAIGIHDGRAMLTLANIGAEAERLAEREPILGTEAALDHRTPEDGAGSPRSLAWKSDAFASRVAHG